MRRDGKHLVLSETVSFMGCLFYGAGIWLVAQAFHLEAHYPDGVWWWAIGVLPFALCLDSLLLHVLFVSLLALWGGMEVFGFRHLSPWWMYNLWELPNGAYSLPLLAAPGMAGTPAGRLMPPLLMCTSAESRPSAGAGAFSKNTRGLAVPKAPSEYRSPVLSGGIMLIWPVLFCHVSSAALITPVGC